MDRGIVPLKYLGGGDGGAFIPQCLENVIAKCHSDRDIEKERNKRYDTSDRRVLSRDLLGDIPPKL